MVDIHRHVTKIKDKANELGIIAKEETFQLLSRSTNLLPSIIGHELVLSTFVPMIPSLIVDSVKRELLEKHVTDLGQRLHENFEKLNKEFIQSKSGRKLFKETINEILEETSDEKIEMQKTFLINSFITRDKNEETIQSYHEILLNLSPIGLHLVQHLMNPEKWVPELFKNKVGHDESDYFDYAIKIDLANVLNIEYPILERIAKKLDSDGIIKSDGHTVNWSEGRYHYSNVQEAIKRTNDDCKRLVTQFGKNFYDFLTK